MRFLLKGIGIFLWMVLALSHHAYGQQPALDDDADLLNMNIDQLGNADVVVPSFDVEVTSVTRSESTVGKSPAAVFVVTKEMIRRSGATSIPDILRMVPGLQVAQIDANKWTVSSRGFNGFVSNKTLIMIDGRKVATPLFDGTLFGSINWDAQDLVIQDIERIEVVRGPGGTLWSTDAVNGVINVITKKAADTQGWLYSGTFGSEDRAINSVRYGGSLGSDLHYRFYFKHFERDKFSNNRTDGRHGDVFEEGAAGDWRQLRFGFRSDWQDGPNGNDAVTFQGDYYTGVSGFSQEIRGDVAPFDKTFPHANTNISGGNLLGRWTHTFNDESSFTAQAYFDHAERSSLVVDTSVNIFDLDLTHQFLLHDKHHMTWGARYRSYTDTMRFPNGTYLYDPSSRSTNLVSVFIQDKISLIEDKLDWWVGTSLQHNDYTGAEAQPSTRLLWTLDSKQVVWAAISRSVRPPSRTEDGLNLQLGSHNHGFTAKTPFKGNQGLAAENVIAYELGYRAQPADYFSWDVSGFYNTYTDLIAFSTQGLTAIPGGLALTDMFENNMDGEAYGVEINATLDLTDSWRVRGSYSYVQILLDLEPRADPAVIFEEGITPHHQVYVQSSWDLPHNLEFDLIGRFVDKLPSASVRGYLDMDARLAYRPNESWEFSLVGRNLLAPNHREFEQILVTSNRVDRSVFAQIVWTR